MPKNFVKSISMNSLWVDKISYWAVVLYVLDVVCLGTGDITKIGGISTRMLFLGIAFITSIPFLIRNYKSYWKNKGVVLIGIFLCAVVISGIYGVLSDNNMSILIGDIKGYLNIFILIPMMCTLRDKERVIKLLKIVIWAVVLQCFVSIFLCYMEMYPKPLSDFIYKLVNKKGLGILTGITTRSARVFLYSGSRMSVLCLLLAFSFWLLERRRVVLRYFQMTACLVLAFFSYGRAIYLGLAVVLVLLLLVIAIRYREYLSEMIKKCLCVLLLTGVVLSVIGLTQQTNLFKAAIDRCIVAVMSDTIEQPDVADSVDMNIGNLKAEVDSIEIREEREATALENFKKSPIWGHGLGVVNDSDNETIEYFYLDLLTKMGIIGLVLFLLPVIWAFYTIIKEKNNYSEDQRLLSLACGFGLLFLMIISYFNPCMNTSWGLMVYGLVITMAVPWKE